MSANMAGTDLDRINQNAGIKPVKVEAELIAVLERALTFTRAALTAFLRRPGLAIDRALFLEYIVLMEAVVQAELDMLRDIIVQTVPVDQIFLFGSYAYGTPHKDSDLDLYVVLKDDVEMRDIDAGLKIRQAIGDKQNMPLDIIVSKQSKYQKERLMPGIERVISRKGVVLYG
jgi:predicted nucleotidyltransferase